MWVRARVSLCVVAIVLLGSTVLSATLIAPVRAASDTCATPPVRRVGDALVVARRERRPSAIVYRLDNVDGYWLFPASNARVAALAVPAAAAGSINLSVVQETEIDGTVRTCSPRPTQMLSVDSAEIPAEAERLEPLPFVSEPLPCGVLDRPARIINAVAPTTPRIAAQQGISGDVRVEIALDEHSEVTSAKIVASPSSLLNDPSLEAARQSTFAAEQFRCAAVPAHFIFIVTYRKQ